ncbi:MAG TPA: ribonuclease Y [Candidatus Polarisedimenticolaceae bacterium]|nr:ribonuclease Y [Candidatus Polarisedimenticolaceae bacterium]
MNLGLLPAVAATLAALLVLGGAGWWGRRVLARAQASARALLVEAQQEAQAKGKEILVAAEERGLVQQEEADRRERELDERETAAQNRLRQLEADGTELKRQRSRLDRQRQEVEQLQRAAREAEASTRADRDAARRMLEQVAGLTAEEARARLIAGIEEEARQEGARIARRIEDDARERAEREAVNLIVRAFQRVNLREVAESTVTFIELPSDEMKGRIIGREGRNIRALEMATGIDLIVDDTPRSIVVSSFDPLRREIARVAIDRLVEDGRIHPARIEEVVARAREELETLVEQRGSQAAFDLGISDLHPKLARLVGRMRYHISHGQNLLQHCLETAWIAGFMALELKAGAETVRRAALLHEVGQVEGGASGHPALASAEICAKLGEAEPVVQAIRSLHPDAQATSLEALLVGTANRLSESRPGARKENLAVFIERLRRLEGIATGFAGVERAYAIKAGKEIRVIVDSKVIGDEAALALSKQIARALERELNYPGQIKVTVVRETRAVRYAV